MKRVRVLILVLSLALLGGLFQATAQAATVVNFPDANLETVVRDALGKPTGDITDVDMLTLRSLYGGGRGIVDLRGLEYATNLVNLSLQNNSISDITPVKNLTNLTYLRLNHNSISDITPVKNLTNLAYLSLIKNSISNITAVENLTNLKFLLLGSNSISDITPVQNLTNLMYLNLMNNSISDITAVQNLTNLTNLSLSWNQISDITAVENLTNLTDLELFVNQISDITAVKNLTNLTELHLARNSISDVAAVENLTNLMYLNLGYNSISDITAAENLTDLTTLLLYDNSISNITAVENLTNLTNLSLHKNSISDITPVQNLINLTNLSLGWNQISDITAVQNLTNLTLLWLISNSISDVTPLVTNSLLGGLDTGDGVNVQYNYLDLSPGSDDVADIDALVAAGVIVSFSPQKPPPPEPDIDVSPLEYDFGDVAWLSPSTVIVTITNTGGSDLVVSNLNPTSGPWGSTYSIDNPPLLPVTIPAGGTIDLQIRYTMSSLGPTSAVLEIESDDPDEGVVQIALSGNGVMMEAPPDEQIQAILDFFDESAGDGSLVGEGPGGSANGRLNALRNMIEASGDLIQDGDIDGACQQLLDVYERVDGIEPPVDFVSGSAAQSLALIIQGIRGDLGCQ